VHVHWCEQQAIQWSRKETVSVFRRWMKTNGLCCPQHTGYWPKPYNRVPIMSSSKGRKLLDEVRDVMRFRHYSIHTERAYCEWIKRYVRFHRMTSREDLSGGEQKIEAFLTDLAVNGMVAPATQNQAMNALVFLYKHVLKQPLDEEIDARPCWATATCRQR
jgi:hypothetical protein